jgi:murein DD-endopeptidase MepM/ murein hydrolase activator NlpD
MRVRAGLVAALCVALLTPAVVAHADDDPATQRRRVQAQIASTAGDLDESSAAVRAAAAALARTQVDLPKAQARLDEAEGQLSAARAAVTASGAALVAARDAASAAEADLAAARARLDESRRVVGTLVRSIYQAGPGAISLTVLKADSIGDFAERAEFVKAVMGDGAARVRDATDARAELASTASVLAARQADVARRDTEATAALARVETLVAQAADARAAVAAQVAARAAALAAANRERAADLARYRALQAESARLAELIRRVSRGTGRVGRGGMLWPTHGPVTSGFGWRMHPIYHYMRFHPGIDIGAPTGQAIYAVLPGVVVTAQAMGTYGNIVVVDHGNGFATAYAHQSRILVHVGQHLARGQRLGLVGETGAATGPHLHFETRVNGDPVDPLRYY